jgi:hypothetical protein
MGEFIGIIQCYPKGSGECRQMINKMMSPEYQYIKRSIRAVYNLIRYAWSRKKEIPMD